MGLTVAEIIFAIGFDNEMIGVVVATKFLKTTGTRASEPVGSVV